MRVVAALALAISLGTITACDRVGRSVVGAPGSVVPDVGPDDLDATEPDDLPPPLDAPAPVDRPDVPAVCDGGQASVNGVCVMDGELTFTLTWDEPGNMDLHVVTPDSFEIYAGDPSTGNGMLERDDSTGTGPENIYWTTAPRDGEYIVCAVPNSISMVTHFTMTARYRGMIVNVTTGTSNDPLGDISCTDMTPAYVATVTIPPVSPDM